jgi:hypothetical protein
MVLDNSTPPHVSLSSKDRNINIHTNHARRWRILTRNPEGTAPFSQLRFETKLHNILPHKPRSSISGIVTRLKLDRNCVLTKFQIASVYGQNRNKCSTLSGRQQNTQLPSRGRWRCISCCPVGRQLCTMCHITIFILFG